MPDNASLSNFIQLAQKALTQGYGSNNIQKILYAGDPNSACQLITSLSQMLNSMGSNTLQSATSGD
jgi:hypothetical protein